MSQTYPPGLRSVIQLGTSRSEKAFLGSWACGLPPVHPTNRFAFNSRRKAPRTTALRFRRALIAAVLTKDRAARLSELGKSRVHTLTRLRFTQDPLHLLLKLR